MLSKEPEFSAVQGLAALDPVVAAHKQFIAKNKGGGDLLNFIRQDQGATINPNLAAAMIVLEQMEKAKGNKAGPQPTTTVMDDVAAAGMQAAQQTQGGQPPQQGVAGLPNPAMANAQFQGGITQQPKAPPPQMPQQAPRPMATGGIVALAAGGNPPTDLSGIDFSQMDMQQLNMLAKDPDVTLSQAAAKEYLRRTGYTDAGDWLSNQFSGASKNFQSLFPLVRMKGGIPDYMRDEKGRVRAEGPSAGIAGLRESNYGQTRFVTPAAASQWNQAVSATPPNIPPGTPAGAPPAAAPGAPGAAPTSPAMGGSPSFQDLVDARRRAQQGDVFGGMRPTAPPPSAGADLTGREKVGGVGGTSVSGDEIERLANRFAPAPQSIADAVKAMREARGPNKAAEEYGAELEKMKAQAEKEANTNKWLALAKAGFTAAATRGPLATSIAAGGAQLGEDLMANAKNLATANRYVTEGKFKLADAQRREDAEDLRDAIRDNRSAQVARSQIMSDIFRSLSQERSLDRRQAASDRLVALQLSKLDSQEKRDQIKSSIDATKAEIASLTNQRLLIKPSDTKAIQQIDNDLASATAYLGSLRKTMGIQIPTDLQDVFSKYGNR